jgi:uracil-DNA glycosylase
VYSRPFFINKRAPERSEARFAILPAMEVNIEQSWKEKLEGEFEKPYFEKLTTFVKDEYKSASVYPPPKFIFRAFELTPFDQVKVVILGQDPYHGPQQANGLCFAVNEGVTLPPSLINIYKELSNDCGLPFEALTKKGDFVRWAQQGILLLNATLTVRARTPGSHQHKGWEEFTDAVIRVLSEGRENLVFILWGNYARQKGAHIDREKHFVIESPHPSPFSASNGFFGSKPFSQTNDYLVAHGKDPIDWLS